METWEQERVVDTYRSTVKVAIRKGKKRTLIHSKVLGVEVFPVSEIKENNKRNMRETGRLMHTLV